MQRNPVEVVAAWWTLCKSSPLVRRNDVSGSVLQPLFFTPVSLEQFLSVALSVIRCTENYVRYFVKSSASLISHRHSCICTAKPRIPKVCVISYVNPVNRTSQFFLQHMRDKALSSFSLSLGVSDIDDDIDPTRCARLELLCKLSSIKTWVGS
jgi:hypothetical protein